MATAGESSGAGTSPYVIVAAIDFGTTFSGYAFSFKGAETDIRLNKNWGDTVGFLSYKTPTTVLLKGKDLQFEAFGYEAEEGYMEPQDEDEPVIKNLYRHFKMVLHKSKTLTLKTNVWSTDGHISPAIDIFTHALRYLKDHLLEQLSQELANPPDTDMIRWVITVPAIWPEVSKNFMREAAFRSGCIQTKDSRQLVIALEPEVASFFCRQLDLVPFKGEENIAFPPGTKYLILDCGGGTNDMIAHEVVVDFKVKEIIAVTGGSHGGTEIEENFLAMLAKLLGSDFLRSFRDKFPDQWFSFLTKFERLKKQAKNDGKPKRLELPYNLEQQYSTAYPQKSFESAFTTKEAEGIKVINGILILSNNFIKSIFNGTIQNIAKDLRDIYSDPKLYPLRYIFMVGCFSENPFLQAAIKSEFGSNGCKVLVPNEAQLAVIKGAVLFGHHQDHVISRIVRETYGFDMDTSFDPDHHDSSRKVISDYGSQLCTVFQPVVWMNDEIDMGTCKEHSLYMEIGQQKMEVSFYSLPREPQSPFEYPDAPDIKELAEIVIERPIGDTSTSRRDYTIKMTFGNTEILAEVVDDLTGENVAATLNYLNE